MLPDATFDGTFDVLLEVAGDDLFFFLADRLDALVGVGQFDAADAVEDSHDLLLVDHDAVGLFEHRIDQRMHLGRRLAAVFHIDVVHDHAAFERAGAVQGGGRDDVGKFVRLHLREQVTNAAGFKLEHALRFAALQQLERFLIVERQLDRLDLFSAMLPDVGDRLVQDRQVAEAQKIHLEQAGLLDVRAVPLRDDVFFAVDGLQRDVVVDRRIADDDTGRVRADIASQSFEPLRDVEQLFDFGIGVVRLLHVGRLFDRILDLDVEFIRDRLRDLIDASQRDAECSADVADRELRLERAERADLTDVVVTVFGLRVVDDFLPAVATEVDVDIRRLGAAGIEESLEQQVVLQRANVTQAEQVRDDRPARRTASTARNVVLFREPHEVPHDQEVARIAHRLDRREFEIQPRSNRGGDVVAVAPRQPLFAQFAEVLRVGQVVRSRESRIVLRVLFQFDVHAIGDELRLLDRFLVAGKRRVHFFRRANEELIAVHPHSLLVVDR